MEEKKIIIRKMYKNPRHTVAEDYSLIPTCTEQAEESGYQDINVLIARFTRGELCDFGHRPENPLADMLEQPIEDIKEQLDELAEQSKQGREQAKEQNLSGVPSEISANESGDNTAEKKAESSK